jgi:hypothetical protein
LAATLCARLVTEHPSGDTRERALSGLARRGGLVAMPSRSNRSSGKIEAEGEGTQEPLIDRKLELDLLRQHIDRVVETRKGHVVLVLGESGVGKSRLAAEAAAKARGRGLTIIPIRCLGRGAEPLLSLKEGLAAYLGRTPDQIQRTLAHSAPRLLDAVPFIGTFLGTVGERLRPPEVCP